MMEVAIIILQKNITATTCLKSLRMASCITIRCLSEWSFLLQFWRRKQSSKETPVQWFLNSDHFDVYVLLYSFMQEGPNHFILEDPKLMMKPVVYLNEITMDVDEKNEEIPK